LAKASLQYAKDPFEKERAERLIDISAEIIATYSVAEFEQVQLAFHAQPGYVTPKIDVRAAVFQGKELLFVQEAIDQSWTLPGGWADVGESPRDSIEREVLEEAGLTVQADRLIGVYDANRVEGMMTLFHAYKLLFLCELKSGEVSTSLETMGVGFFPLDSLPTPLSPHRTPVRLIEDSIAAYEDPVLPTYFD
jgi:ADP-ribose pyrophosphatase YjhB (NUDIX family)